MRGIAWLWNETDKSKGEVAGEYAQKEGCSEETAEIVRLAEWDTMNSHVFAEQVIKYVRAYDTDKLPQKVLFAF